MTTSSPNPDRKTLAIVALVAFTGAAGCAHLSRPPEEADTKVSVHKGLAKTMIERRDFAGATTVLAGLYRDFPNDSEILTLRGIAMRGQGMPTEARVEFEQAVKANPRNAQAHGELGVLLAQLGQPREARAALEAAVKLQPNEHRWLNNLGFLYMTYGYTHQAIPLLEQARRLAPSDPRIQNNLGFAYARLGNFERARYEFERAGNLAVAANNLGFAYQVAGRWREAAAEYDRALVLDPQMARAHFNRATLQGAKERR